jgi:hypothetical protein
LLSVPLHWLLFQVNAYVPSIPQAPLPAIVKCSVVGNPPGQQGVPPQPVTVTSAVQLLEAKSDSAGVNAALIVWVDEGVQLAVQVQLTFWLFVESGSSSGNVWVQRTVPSTETVTVPSGASPLVGLPSLLVTVTVIVTAWPSVGLAGLRVIEQVVVQLPHVSGGDTSR